MHAIFAIPILLISIHFLPVVYNSPVLQGRDTSFGEVAEMEPALRLLLVLMVFMPCTGDVNVWPMPKSVSNGKQTVFISKDLKMTVVGSNYSDEKAILRDAFGRMVAVVEQDHVISESYERSPVLVGMNVVVRSRDDEVLAVLLLMGTRTPVNFVLCVLILKIGLLQLNFGVDESYSLFVPSTGHPLYAQIEVSNDHAVKKYTIES